MRRVHWLMVVGAIALAASGGSRAHSGPQAPSVPLATSPASAPIAVPEGNGVPVITDGIFSPGEWVDAHRLALRATVHLLIKQYRGVVFIGVRGSESTVIGATDLFLAVPDGPVHQLHVSAQLGEIVLPATGDAPPFRFGLTPDWYANEQRRDMQEAARLEKEGKSRADILKATSYPSDGIEFAIRRSKFAAPRWLLRLTTSFLAGDRPGMLVHPVAAAERMTDAWQVLRFD